MSNPPVDQTAGRHPASPPCTRQELVDRVRRYQRSQSEQHIPLEPPDYCCPGVYGHGCGSPLCVDLLERVQDGCFFGTFYSPEKRLPPLDVIKCTRPRCSYKHILPERIHIPQIAIMAVSQTHISVEIKSGAEKAVEHCGGVRSILNVLGCREFGVNETKASGRTKVMLPCKSYKHILEAFNKLKYDFDKDIDILPLSSHGGQIPPGALEHLLKSPGQCRASSEEVEERRKKVPAYLDRALLPFQKEAVLFGVQRNGKVLIADEMGVGKTVQAIALASCYADEWPLLIVVPASLRLVWAEELEKWLPHVSPRDIKVIEGGKDKFSKKDMPLVAIISYEMMMRLTCDACKWREKYCPVSPGGRNKKDPEQLPTCIHNNDCMANMGWRVVIVDESHALRTRPRFPDAADTEAVCTTAKRAKRAIFLSGTPALNRPFDLFRQVDALRPKLVGNNRDTFSSTYCGRYQVPVPNRDGNRFFVYNNSGLARGPELHALLKQEIMMRRLKSDVLHQLPEKSRQVVRLPRPAPSDYPDYICAVSNATTAAATVNGSLSSSPEKTPRKRHLSVCSLEEEREEVEEEEEEEEEDEQRGEEGKVAGTPAGAQPLPKKYDAYHKIGIAKSKAVIAWLMEALDVRKKGKNTEEEEDGGVGVGDEMSGGAQQSEEPLPKFLVFAHHITVMNCIAKALEGLEDYPAVGFIRIDGTTDSQDRRDLCNAFRNDPRRRVALLSITAAGVGLDFSSASVVVFAELPKEASLVRQAEDRAHRQGQRNSVNVYFLCAKGTIEERRWHTLSRNLTRVAAVHDGVVQGFGLLVDSVIDQEDEGGEEMRESLPPRGGTAGVDFHQEAQDDDRTTTISSVVDLTRSISSSSFSSHEEDNGRLQKLTEASRDAGHDMVQEGEDSAQQHLFFEISRNSNRVHFIHVAEDSNHPLLLNMPLEAFGPNGECPLADIVLHNLAGSKECAVPGLGVIACDHSPFFQRNGGKLFIEKALREAAELAAEWRELSLRQKSKLYERLLKPPLTGVLEAIEAEVRVGGKSTSRYLTQRRTDLDMPDGVELKPVEVYFAGLDKTVTYSQPTKVDGTLLCLHCLSEVLPGGGAFKEHGAAPLTSTATLFCSGKCEEQHKIRTNASSYRRALFRLERGICTSCNVDCHLLVKRLRCIEIGSFQWKQKREELLKQIAPAFANKGNKLLIQRLVTAAVEGNAWHADHIVPVYEGGGQCSVENLRTLCVICHKKVTAEQAAARSKKKRASAEKPKRRGAASKETGIVVSDEDDFK